MFFLPFFLFSLKYIQKHTYWFAIFDKLCAFARHWIYTIIFGVCWWRCCCVWYQKWVYYEASTCVIDQQGFIYSHKRIGRRVNVSTSMTPLHLSELWSRTKIFMLKMPVTDSSICINYEWILAQKVFIIYVSYSCHNSVSSFRIGKSMSCRCHTVSHTENK